MTSHRLRAFVPLKWFILAVQFATIVPTPQVSDVTDRDMRYSMMFLPAVGLCLGAVLWALQIALQKHLPALSRTMVSFTVYTILSGALHLDGLMDTADALGSRRPRDQALAIMKDSRVGAMGVVAGTLTILGKFVAISSLSTAHAAPFLIVPMVSRLGILWSMVLAPCARPDGLGALFAKKIPAWVIIVATLSCAAICAGLLPLQRNLEVLIYFFVIVIGFTTWMKIRFGGTTGDTYGALPEVLEWVGWIVFS